MSAVQFSLPPLTVVRDRAELVAWLNAAKPGARFVYAQGAGLPRASATIALVREAHGKGTVDLVQQRNGRTIEYLAVRRAGGAAACAAPAPARRATDIDEAADAAVWREVKRAVSLQWPCPTNAELAKRAGLPDAAAASYRLRKLVAAGRIAIEDHGPNRHRTLTIVATGRSTREASL